MNCIITYQKKKKELIGLLIQNFVILEEIDCYPKAHAISHFQIAKAKSCHTKIIYGHSSEY